VSMQDGAPRPGAEPAEPQAGPRAAAAAERLAELDALPPEEHVRVYDELHAGLQSALATMSGEGGSPAARGGPVPRSPGRGA
jgi:hypothetical protein